MATDTFIQIGKLGKPYGLKGEIKLLLWDEFVDFLPQDVLFVPQHGDKIPFFLEYSKVQGAHVLAKFEDFQDPNAVYKLAQKPVFLREKDIPDAFLVQPESDMEHLLDYQLRDKTLGHLGPIIGYDDGGLQQMILVAYDDQEIMIPWVESYILKLDEKKQIILVDLPEGLLNT